MHVRLGDILKNRGLLSATQVDHALAYQKDTGEPFGLICERLFNIDPEAVEEAWEAQYISLTQRIDPRHEMFEEKAIALISRRQAWQFRVLPIRFDEDELVIATTAQHLRRALRFSTRCLCVPAYFVIAEAFAMGEALCRIYPLAGMTPASVNDDALDRLLEKRRNSAA